MLLNTRQSQTSILHTFCVNIFVWVSVSLYTAATHHIFTSFLLLLQSSHYLKRCLMGNANLKSSRSAVSLKTSEMKVKPCLSVTWEPPLFLINAASSTDRNAYFPVSTACHHNVRRYFLFIHSFGTSLFGLTSTNERLSNYRLLFLTAQGKHVTVLPG